PKRSRSSKSARRSMARTTEARAVISLDPTCFYVRLRKVLTPSTRQADKVMAHRVHVEEAMKLEQQSIIVTGGASGIGYHAAGALAAEGANVIIADFNFEGASNAADELRQKGVEAFPFKVDVSKGAEMAAMVDFAVEKLGTLNGIFNNAGIGLVKPFLEMDPATYHKVIEVNQHSVYYGMYYAAKKMVALGAKGTFVNTASID